MKHTKGTWIITEWSKVGTDFYHIRSKNKFTKLIATIHRWKGHLDKGEAKANAKLIAAAPKLLNTLENIENILSQDIPKRKFMLVLLQIRRDVNKAIKKATNETKKEA